MLPLLTETSGTSYWCKGMPLAGKAHETGFLHELFEEQDKKKHRDLHRVPAERTTHWTPRANRLARHRLRALGVGPEAGVRLCAEHSVEFMIGLLGILKAGRLVCTARPGVSGSPSCFEMPSRHFHRCGGASSPET